MIKYIVTYRDNEGYNVPIEGLNAELTYVFDTIEAALTGSADHEWMVWQVEYHPEWVNENEDWPFEYKRPLFIYLDDAWYSLTPLDKKEG